MTLRTLTGGESHGPALTAILEGLWSNVDINVTELNHELSRRQQGYGRGGRMKIEKDRVNILSGVRHGKTLGSPITLQIVNKDFENWRQQMSPDPLGDMDGAQPVTNPRPGHADFAGTVKYRHRDIRNVLERSSARETAIRTAVGSLTRQVLKQLGIEIYSHVVAIGQARIDESGQALDSSYRELGQLADESPVRCVDKLVSEQMISEIDQAKEEGDTLGGVFELIATGIPVGLGSHVHYDRKLDGILTGALMSLQGIKGVEIGKGFACASLPGSKAHDELFYDETLKFRRGSNSAGGLEGGMTNGEPLVLRCAMKPIPTLMKSLQSVNLETKESVSACVERSDACAVPAASVVGEAIVAYELTKAIKDKFSGDSLEELLMSYENYLKFVREV